MGDGGEKKCERPGAGSLKLRSFRTGQPSLSLSRLARGAHQPLTGRQWPRRPAAIRWKHADGSQDLLSARQKIRPACGVGNSRTYIFVSPDDGHRQRC